MKKQIRIFPFQTYNEDTEEAVNKFLTYLHNDGINECNIQVLCNKHYIIVTYLKDVK